MNFRFLSFCTTLFCSLNLIDSLSSSPIDNGKRKHVFEVARDGSTPRLTLHRDFKMSEDRVVDHHSISMPDIEVYETKSADSSKVTPWTEFENLKSAKIGWILLNRKTRAPDPLVVAKLEVYEADPEKNTISLRLSPLDPTEAGIDEYRVSIPNWPLDQKTSNVHASNSLRCALWGNSVCFEDFPLPSSIVLANLPNLYRPRIEVDGIKKGVTLKPWHFYPPLTDYREPPDPPSDLTLTNRAHGIVTVKWGHPWIPRRKIKEFNIQISYVETDLSDYQDDLTPRNATYPVKQAQKEYTMDLPLQTSTKYFIIVMAESDGAETQDNIWVSSGVAFADGERLQVKGDGTFIELTLPKVVNATRDTTISVIVMNGHLECTPNPPPTSPSTNTTEWVAAEYKIDEYKQKSPIVIGDPQANEKLLDCALQPGETYTVEVKVVDHLGNKSDTITSTPITITSNSTSARIPRNEKKQDLTWIIVFPIATACGLLIGMWYKKRRKILRQSSEPRELSESNYVEPISPVLITSSTMNLTARYSPWSKTPENQSYLEILPSPSSTSITPKTFSTSTDLYAIANETNSRSISIGYFEEYAKEAANNGWLISQFMMLRGGLTDSCEYGSLPENMSKNRDRNQIAYDSTRVVLQKIPGDPYSDYINASYIKGYKKERAYIATQGPLPNTVNDFWRMVWQKEVRVICMLTNVIEGTKEKCYKYWPDVGADENYGNFRVLNKNHEVFADYTFRTFELSYKQDKREITHLHYTGWPSFGVPMYPQSLVAYLKKLKATPAGHGPVVVHCHTGDDRTGTVILCDICIRRAAVEKVIDVLAVTKIMRDSRANMVSTLQEYLLGHIVIAESMLSLPTQIPCDADLSKRINKMRMQLHSDIQRLKDTMWQEQSLKDFATLERSHTNNLADGEPSGIIKASLEETDLDLPEMNRVNAVSVDGIKMKKEYLACSLPSPFTLSNFWAFVTERNIQLMIILQCSDPKNPTCSDVLPDESIMVPLPDIQVEKIQNPGKENYFTSEKLRLTNPPEKNAMAQSVTILTCKGWGRGENGEPPPTSTLVSLWIASEKIPRDEGRTLVLCHDGITGCGLYLALSFLLERMALERECDVISAVRAVRRSKSEFVRALEQYEYLYDAAETYAEYFQCYANFT